VIVPTALMGVMQHYRQDNVDWRMAASLAPLAIAGGYCGARLAEAMSAGSLKRGFGALLLLVGLRLLLMK